MYTTKESSGISLGDILLSAPIIKINLQLLIIYLGDGYIPTSNAPTREISLCNTLYPFQPDYLLTTFDFKDIFFNKS